MTICATAAVVSTSSSDWELLTVRVPQLTATMRRYLMQQAVSLSPATAKGPRFQVAASDEPMPGSHASGWVNST